MPLLVVKKARKEEEMTEFKTLNKIHLLSNYGTSQSMPFKYKISYAVSHKFSPG